MKMSLQKSRLSYRSIKLIAKIGQPFFRVLMYVSLVSAAILIIMAPIIFVVNIPTEEMILPPYMRAVVNEDVITSYDISIGNGIRLSADAADVTLDDIKTVIYAGIFMATAILLVVAPICRFISSLFRNITNGLVLERKNADLISYIGITVLIGNTIVLFLSRFYNYLLVSTFLGEEGSVRLALNIDWYGIIMGAFILMTGMIFGYACEQAQNIRSIVPSEQQNPEEE